MQMSDDTIKVSQAALLSEGQYALRLPRCIRSSTPSKTGWKSDQGDHQECPEMGSGTHDPGGAQSDVCWQESLWLLLVGFQYTAD